MATAVPDAEDVGMTTDHHPLAVYRRFQSYLLRGDFARLGEVADMDGYTENCVGLTGWTTGLLVALRNFQENIASRLTDMVVTEHEVIEAGDMLVIRGAFEVTHSGEFLSVAPTGRRASYDWVDMYRVADGRIVWRYLLCDWKGLLDQLTVAA
jgi:predicted ester cyclase